MGRDGAWLVDVICCQFRQLLLDHDELRVLFAIGIFLRLSCMYLWSVFLLFRFPSAGFVLPYLDTLRVFAVVV